MTAPGPLGTPCWIWQGRVTTKGYAQRSIDGRRLTVSRAVLEATLGRPLAADEHAHHRCETKRCVNPEHLEPLTTEGHALAHHTGDRTALQDALELLAQHPRMSPATIARFSGHPPKAVAMALWRAERSGVVRRLARGEYEVA